MKQLPTPVRVVILTPIAAEYRAMTTHLSELHRETVEGNLYETGLFEGMRHKYVVSLQETGPKNTPIALATQKAVRLFQPVVVLLAGIAGGVKDVRTGDVAVGTKAYGYESGKETDQGSVSRPDVMPFSKELVEVARMVGRSDDWRKRTRDGAPGARFFFGPIASGDKVIASTASPLYQYLKQHYNDALALEMESIGFAQAVAPHRKVYALNIRGISDLLDHKSGTDEVRRQELAAERAAAFAFELLYQLDCSPFILPDMDAKTIAKEIYALLFPVPASFKEIGNDFSNAANNEVREIWKRVKPIFIEEVEELAKDPEDAAARGAAEMKLRKSVEKDATLGNELTALIENAKASGAGASVAIVNSKNVVSGSTISVGGDFRLGDG